MIELVGEYGLQNEVQTNLAYTANSQERNRRKGRKSSLPPLRETRVTVMLLSILHVN